MLLATWNINGIRARHERVLAWVESRRPDVLCLQEIKTVDEKFPREPYEALGYEVGTHGQKAYNGVAILSRAGLRDVERGFGEGEEDPHARLLGATLSDGTRVISAYFPNGKEVGSPQYEHKLAWMERLRAKLAASLKPTEKWALCGDLNVTRADIDVHDPAEWDGRILCSESERGALMRIQEVGLVDVARELHPDKVMFTWWDYRALGFPKNRGLRLDYILATPALMEKVTAAEVDRDARKGKQPSDHAPLVVTTA